MSVTMNVDHFTKQITENIRGALLQSAEPLVKEALAHIEKAMRAKLAEVVLARVNADYECYRDGMNLKIQVKLDG